MSEEIGRVGGPKNVRETLLISSETADRNRHEIYEFGPFRLEPAERKLSRGDDVVTLTPKVFDMLVMLVRHSGHLLEKDDLIRSLWPDSFVEEGNLSNNIFVLRKALGNEREYIETVPRRGYRFVGAVRQLPPAGRNAISGVLEGQMREVPSRQKPRGWKILFAAVAAALLLFATVFVLWRFRGENSASSPNSPRLAVEQRLTSNPSDVPLQNAVISRDGKYLAYADATGLYLREISSGETRPWSLPKGFVARPESWFPDGTHLLVLRIAERPQVYALWKPSLYKLSILGGEPQLMMSDAAGGDVSPDGSQIAYLPWPGSNEIWIMNADGANPRRAVSGGGAKELWTGIYESWIHHVAWSPAGHHLAYIEDHAVAGPIPAGPTHALRITDPNGAGQTKVLDDSRIGDALWWAPDGRILFAYDEDLAGRQSNYGVYSIRVDEHTRKAVGPPQPVTQAEGRIRSMSGTADGKRLVVSRRNSPPQVFIAGFDAALHRWNEPRRLILDANLNIATAWTADSKSVLFISNRNGPEKLFRQAIDETTPEVLAEGRSIYLPRLSADGSQVLYLSSSNPDDVSFPVSLMSKPLAGGAPRVVVHGKGIWNHQCAYSPATRCIFSQFDGQNLIFRSFDLEHGEGRELLRMVGFSNWSLSSDGSKLAIIPDPHHIRFVSLDTGAAHDVTVQDWVLDSVDWEASGQTLFMPRVAPNGLSVILEVDQTGKAKVILTGSANTKFGYMIQSPDSRYALLGEFIPTGNNAWIVDDF